jgi:hypothetical protein
LRPEAIVSQSADHLNRVAQSRNGDSLIGPLAAGMNLEVCSENRLSDCWNPVGDGDQVDVNAAHDDDWPFLSHSLLQSKSEPSSGERTM